MFGIFVVSGVLRWLLVGSYRIGEFIVYTGIVIVQTLVEAVKNFNYIFNLAYEGSALWLRDIQEYFYVLQELIQNIYDYFLEIVVFIITAIGKAICTPLSLLVAVVLSIRELLLLLGSSCLFLLSLPPLFLLFVLDMLLNLFKIFRSFVWYTAKRFADYIVDAQSLEILLGIIVSCGLILITMNGSRLLARWYAQYKKDIIRTLRIWAAASWEKTKKRLKTGKRRKPREPCKPHETELCVICFNKTRSVCLLPCRHLCLCDSCPQSLPRPMRCPLCRQPTMEFLRVYL